MMGPRWAAVVGTAREGRDDTLDALIADWRAAGLAVGGFRPREGGVRDERGKSTEIFLEDVSTGTRLPLAVTDPSTPDVCSYRFDAATFEAARAWCVAASRAGGVVLLAGLGPLEAAGRGHAPVVATIVSTSGPALPVLVIRRDALATIALPLPDPVAALELPADEPARRAFAQAVEGALRPETV